MTSFTPTHTGVSRFSFPDMLHPDGGRVSVKIGDLANLAQSAYAKDIFYVVGHGPRGWSPLTSGSPYFSDLSALAHVFDGLREVLATATTTPDRNQGVNT